MRLSQPLQDIQQGLQNPSDDRAHYVAGKEKPCHLGRMQSNDLPKLTIKVRLHRQKLFWTKQIQLNLVELFLDLAGSVGDLDLCSQTSGIKLVAAK